MDLRRLYTAAAFGLALAFAAPSFAEDLGVAVDTACTAMSSTQPEDEAALDAALAAAYRRGYSGLSQHLDQLRTVAEHAPSCYPEIRERGNTIIVRTEAPGEVQALGLALAAAAAQRGETVSVEIERNIYPMAFLYLASHAVEYQRYDDALTWLSRGLALQPDNQYLLFEKGAALGGLRRFDEAAALFQGMLDNPSLSLTLDRARAYRSLGIALIDVPRLDDAEAALTQSLALEPGNALAQHELQYIAELRRGGNQRAFELNAPLSERSRN